MTQFQNWIPFVILSICYGIKKPKFMLIFHLTNLKNPATSKSGEYIVSYDQESSKKQEFLLQTLEINRKLIAAILRECELDHQCVKELDNLIQECKILELTTSNSLKNSSL